MKLRYLAAAAVFVSLAGSAQGADNRVVVELFTSQGCSSCPAADKLLGELAAENKLIALSLPVDYWDYLGWRDTLALSQHSQRQRGYSELRGDHSVFTPQIVINGVMQAVGSDRNSIEADAHKLAEKSSVPVAVMKNGARLEVDVGPGSGAPASVWLLTVAKETPVMIGRGENRGKTIIYHNVVRSWQRIADWNGSPLKNSVALADLDPKDADAVAVLVQSGSVEQPGPIRGAALFSLH